MTLQEAVITPRAKHEDGLVMYLVVKKSLAMSPGKMAAQVGHAVGLLDQKFEEVQDRVNSIHEMGLLFGGLLKQEIIEEHELKPKFEAFNNWRNTFYGKIVLVASDRQWEELKNFPDHVMVVDAGLTELQPNTETVIGLWPMLKSEAHETMIKKLQVLK